MIWNTIVGVDELSDSTIWTCGGLYFVASLIHNPTFRSCTNPKISVFSDSKSVTEHAEAETGQNLTNLNTKEFGRMHCHMQGVKQKLQLVDVPGHPRMRALLQEWCRRAAAVIFVLDAADFIQQKSEIAGCADLGTTNFVFLLFVVLIVSSICYSLRGKACAVLHSQIKLHSLKTDWL
jgi:hypothetical protein